MPLILDLRRWEKNRHLTLAAPQSAVGDGQRSLSSAGSAKLRGARLLHHLPPTAVKRAIAPTTEWLRDLHPGIPYPQLLTHDASGFRNRVKNNALPQNKTAKHIYVVA